MPNKKPDPKPETDTSKAVVSRLGVNDDPVPTEPKIVKTKNGNTITYNQVTYYGPITSCS